MELESRYPTKTMSSPTIAFFGATGDVAGHCLAYCLKAGYLCIALARTPAKLYTSMGNKGVGSSILQRQLTVVEGNAKDVAAVKRARCNSTATWSTSSSAGSAAHPRAR